jgi:CheY-like chemotaxis protein
MWSMSFIEMFTGKDVEASEVDSNHQKVNEELSLTYSNSSVSSGTAHFEKVVGRLEPSSMVGELANSVKQVLVIDDEEDNALSIKACLESYWSEGPQEAEQEFHAIAVTMYVDPVSALREFKPYFYDLLLVDINMPSVNGYELVEKIIKLDLNIKICFMSAGEFNYEAIREIHHPANSFGCFIAKPATKDYLVNRVVQELF